jgi:glycosyltransferase involved in cell wall biosynthesis
MRILQLCKKFPYPLKDGESIAVTHLSKALHALGCEVTLLSMNTTKHYCALESLPPDFDHYKKIHAVQVDNKVQMWDAFVNLFSSESYHITRFLNEEFEKCLVAVLKEQKFDVIQLETPVLSDYVPVIRKYSKAVIAMRSHNVEHEIWERIAENQRFWPLRWYFRYAAQKLKRFEVDHLNDYDLVLAITERDLRTLHKLGLEKPGVVVPIGLNVPNYQPAYSNTKPAFSIGFIGSLDWMPNQEGLLWFLKKVWPGLYQQFPGLKLQIAGRNTPRWLKKMSGDGLDVKGEIENANDFILHQQLMVVPLFAGSGMRVKILETMALGKPVVTTSLGLEGIDAVGEEHVVLANTAEEFQKKIAKLLRNRKLLFEIGHNAQELIHVEYDNLRIASILIQEYHKYVVTSTPFRPVENLLSK